MRIVYLHQYYNAPAMGGGTRSYETARRFVAMGHEVHVITSRRDAPAGSDVWVHTVDDGIHVHWLPVPYSNRMSHGQRLRAFTRFAWGAGSKAASLDGDVVFATSTPLTVALPAIRAARRHGVPMVLEVRDLWPAVPIAMGALRSPVSIAAARWLERFAYRHAARIVALSPEMKAGIVATGYPAKRVSVVPNASDVDLFDIGPAPGRALRERHPWLQDRPLVLYAGSLGALNGVSYLTRLAAEMATIDPDVRFLVIGAGMEETLLRQTAARLGVLDHNFFMLPRTSKPEIAAWMSAADLTTSTVIDQPALWANSANKVFDSFAAAKPVAINHEGWLADILRETGAGLVLDPRDLGAAATRVAAALRDPEWLAGAAGAGRELARGRFNRHYLVAQVERVLWDAAAENRARPSPLRRRRGSPVVTAGRGQSVVKRGIDFVASAVALVAALPLLLIAAAAIYLEDRGPVVFRQRRVGLGRREFDLLKFRTMQPNDVPLDTVGQVGPDHPLVTRTGRVLRRFKLDELPQLINVLRGDMSLVGPRPTVLGQVDGYDAFQRRRLLVRPGVTGWAQVNGNIRLRWKERIVLDVWYVDHWSHLLDARILARTLSVVLFGEHPNEHALQEARAHANGAGRSG